MIGGRGQELQAFALDLALPVESFGWAGHQPVEPRLCGGLGLGQQPVSLAQLADDLLRRVPASLHRVLLPLGAIGLSDQADQSQGGRVRSPCAPLAGSASRA
jgi:hypothetical protein